MKVLVLLSLIICAACTERVLREETVEAIKGKASWESYDIHENPFRDFTEQQVKSLLGVSLQWDEHNMHMLVDEDDHSLGADLPANFNSREQWPECAFEVRNQEHCGSCWAFSGASVLTDRFCIASKGQIKEVLSPQDMVSCDSGDMACQGGLLNKAWSYLEKTGIVADKCLPYVSGEGTVPHCPHGACQDTTLKYTKFRAVAGSSKPLTCATQIKLEIFKNGPVQTGFMVYEDFMHYKSGVYEMTHGKKLGGHAVKIVGWGTEAGKDFWIAQNSWGPTWGENGFFRIKQGECLFDENAYAGEANVKDFTPSNFLYWH
jgi:cathepsin B